MMSSRELDALIAEKVFGIDVKWEDKIPCDGEPYFTSDNERVEGYYLNELKCYSTDIAAAWGVLEKVCEGTDWSPQVGLKSCMLFGGFVNDWGPKPTKTIIIKETESAPHAICLAALKAIGVDV
jgi:hypothetical protein